MEVGEREVREEGRCLHSNYENTVATAMRERREREEGDMYWRRPQPHGGHGGGRMEGKRGTGYVLTTTTATLLWNPQHV